MEIGKINVQMTVAEYNRIRMLNERDTAKAFVREKFAGGSIDRCPECGKALGDGEIFCSNCGQRIDTENIAF